MELIYQDAKKLGIDDAKTSSRCLTCHAMDVPEAQRGELFDIENAVGCESCHGPAGDWLKPHAEEGWTPGKRVHPFGDGMGFTLVSGHDLVLQLHLTPTGKERT